LVDRCIVLFYITVVFEKYFIIFIVVNFSCFFFTSSFFYGFSCFALGSTVYKDYCAFGKALDALLGSLGAERIHRLECGDEMSGQEKTFKKWANDTFQVRLLAYICYVHMTF